MVLGRAQVVFSYDSTYLRIAVVRLHPLALVSNQNKLKELKNASLISINRLFTSFSKHHKIYLEINIFVQCNTACWSVSGVESRAHIYITQAWSNDWAFCIGGIRMNGKILLFVIFENGKVYHTLTYQGADVPSMQFFDIEGKPVSNPYGMPDVLKAIYDISEQKWYLPYNLPDFDWEFLGRLYLGVKSMSEHNLKLVKERDDLGLKISKLKKFMKSDDFHNLDEDDQELLKAQKSAMKTYKHILNERIFWEV